MARVFLIGWDGATFDLIRPWVAEGKLPTLAKLMETGTQGPLRSTLPPWTFPAWSSFMTGKNPGKHGIFDFTRSRPGTYDLEFVNGSQRRAPTFWRLLSQAGRPVVAISIPCTYPPEPVNGVMISGFDAPGLGGHRANVDARGMHPPELCEELSQNALAVPIDSIVKEINQGRPDLAVEQSLHTIRQRAAATKYLMTHRRWDCFMVLFGESDGIGHHCWKYSDPHSPLFQDSPGLRDSILRVYQELDRQTGELLELLPPETTVLMMSDHGFGGTSDWVLYPNCWLRDRGLLRFRGGLSHWLSRALDGVKLRAVNGLPVSVKRWLFRLARRRLGGIESQVRYGMIDWSGTEAYFDENPYYPTLWVNLRGRQPKGIVDPGRPYEEVRGRLIQELQAWRHPQTGEPMVEKAFRREEVYSGPCLQDAADVIVKWALCRGYSYAFRLSSKSRRLAWIERVDPNEPHHLEFFSGKSGTHRDYGIFLARGPGIRSGVTIDGARIIDLAPTVLALLGAPVPDDMDGRVLEEIFADGYAKEATACRVPELVPAAPAERAGGYAGENGPYSREDEQKIAERLKSLGYME